MHMMKEQKHAQNEMKIMLLVAVSRRFSLFREVQENVVEGKKEKRKFNLT